MNSLVEVNDVDKQIKGGMNYLVKQLSAPSDLPRRRIELASTMETRHPPSHTTRNVLSANCRDELYQRGWAQWNDSRVDVEEQLR